MAIKLGVVMDPLSSIQYKKDSTLAMMWEARSRNFEIFFISPQEIFLREGKVFANCARLELFHDEKKWFSIVEQFVCPLADFNLILIRKDPPFDLEYLYLTQLLERVERTGVLIVNRPSALRDANEKIFATEFPKCGPATLVTQQIEQLKLFLQEQSDIVCKPLDSMGGESVFRLRYPDENASVIFETLTAHQTKMMMAQKYIPEIKLGDKRILMINGEPVKHALARIPADGELRGNLAAGGRGVAQTLTARDYWICEQVGPTLRDKGIYFAGLDVIGDYLTEINITSPTCIREIDEQTGSNIAGMFLDAVEKMM